MQLARVLRSALRLAGPGVDVRSDVSAAVAVNRGERGAVTSVQAESSGRETSAQPGGPGDRSRS